MLGLPCARPAKAGLSTSPHRDRKHSRVTLKTHRRTRLRQAGHAQTRLPLATLREVRSPHRRSRETLASIRTNRAWPGGLHRRVYGVARPQEKAEPSSLDPHVLRATPVPAEHTAGCGRRIRSGRSSCAGGETARPHHQKLPRAVCASLEGPSAEQSSVSNRTGARLAAWSGAHPHPCNTGERGPPQLPSPIPAGHPC